MELMGNLLYSKEEQSKILRERKEWFGERLKDAIVVNGKIQGE